MARFFTTLALHAAIPILMQYNWLMRRNKAIVEELARFAQDVHGYMMSGGMVRPPTTARPAAAGGAAARPGAAGTPGGTGSSEEHTSELQTPCILAFRLLL